MAEIDLKGIKESLFKDKATRERICRDYGIEPCPENADDFAGAVVRALGQLSCPDPLSLNYANTEVFRCAAWAIGSNMRPWARFMASTGKISNLLHGYDPAQTFSRSQTDPSLVDQIAECLPGQSSRADARAIINWSKLLTDVDDFYSLIKGLALAFQKYAQEKTGSSLEQHELFLCLVAYLSNPPRKWEGAKFLAPKITAGIQKLPGMGIALTSEFLRNLKWNGFKVDRHVKRLFGLWLKRKVSVDSDRINQLQFLIGRRNKDVQDFLRYSMMGIAASPKGIPLSEVDNLVWLLGSYVEKKGRESSAVYVVQKSRARNKAAQVIKSVTNEICIQLNKDNVASS